MDLAHPSTLLMPAGIAALVGWRLWSRLKRLTHRQRLGVVRPWLTVVLLPLLLGLVALGALRDPLLELALLAGLAGGVALGTLGLRRTRYEAGAEGLFYTPYAPLGIALWMLLVLRLAYRAVQLYFGLESLSGGVTGFGRSPLTLLILGVLAGYYLRYAIGLLQWRRSQAEPRR